MKGKYFGHTGIYAKARTLELQCYRRHCMLYTGMQESLRLKGKKIKQEKKMF